MDSDAALSSVYFLRNIFAHLYKINLANPQQPPLIGRYPNDVYDGKDFKYGNPWFLTTISLAHYYYALAHLYLQKGTIIINKDNMGFFQQITRDPVKQDLVVQQAKDPQHFDQLIKSLMNAGDDYIKLIKNYSKCYVDSCFHLSEQLDRANGEPVSAKDLTWSYASLLLALQARDDLARAINHPAIKKIKQARKKSERNSGVRRHQLPA